MGEIIFIDDPNIFENEDALYQFLLDLQEDYEIGDLTDLMQFFVNHERPELYLTVKRFVANDLEK